MDVIIRKIKRLQRIQPNSSWLNSQRSFLLSEIARSQKPVKERKNFLVFPIFNFSKIFRPAFALAFSIIVLISSAGTIGVISAAQNSLSGDLLYPIKTVIEKTQFSFTADPTNRTKLSIKFATQRMDEFTQLIDKPEKKEDIEKTVKNFTQQMVAVREEINTLKEKNVEKAAEVAKIINAQIPTYKEALAKGTEKLGYILPGEKDVLKENINQSLEEMDKIEKITEEIKGMESLNTTNEPNTENIEPQEVVVPSTEEKLESPSETFENLQPPAEEAEKVE